MRQKNPKLVTFSEGTAHITARICRKIIVNFDKSVTVFLGIFVSRFGFRYFLIQKAFLN